MWVLLHLLIYLMTLFELQWLYCINRYVTQYLFWEILKAYLTDVFHILISVRCNILWQRGLKHAARQIILYGAIIGVIPVTECVWKLVDLRLIHTYSAVLLPCRFSSDFSRPRHGRGTAWFVWINIGHLLTACGPSAQFRFLSTTTRNFTIGSSDFSGYTRTFTKDTALW